MLEIKATEKISKAEYKERMKPLQEHLGVLQQNVKAAKLPVIVHPAEQADRMLRPARF